MKHKHFASRSVADDFNATQLGQIIHKQGGRVCSVTYEYRGPERVPDPEPWRVWFSVEDEIDVTMIDQAFDGRVVR